MIIYDGKIITGLTGKWVIPNHAFDITYSTVPNGSISGPSTAYGGETVTVTSTPGSGYLLDYITVNGVAIQGNTFTMPYGNVTISGAFKVNYNPLNLPPYTIRVVTDRYGGPGNTKGTATRVGEYSSNLYIFDVTYNNNDWSQMFQSGTTGALVKVLGANITGVTNTKNMFRQNNRLNEVVLFDTSSVTDMSYMFYDCRELTTIPLYDTHNVTDMSYMFCMSHDALGSNYSRYGLTSCPALDTSKVTNMRAMFRGCSRLSTAPSIDTSKSNNLMEMFYQCRELITVPMYTLHTGNTIELDYMYYYCSSVTSGAYNFYNYAKNFSTSHDSTFKMCGNNSNIPSSWK